MALSFSVLVERLLQHANPHINAQRAWVWAQIVNAIVRKIIDYPNLRFGQFIHDVVTYYFKGTQPNQIHNMLYYMTEDDLLAALKHYFAIMDREFAKKTSPRVNK